MRTKVLLLLLLSLSLLFSIQPLVRTSSVIHADGPARQDRTCINLLHVGDRWWYYLQSLWNPGQDPWVIIGREVVADTLVNGETYYGVVGIGGGDYQPIWEINRGDSIFVLDTGDYDNNPETVELLYFNWALDEDNEACCVFPFHFGSPYPAIQRFEGSSERNLFGGESHFCKQFAFDYTQVFQTWTHDFGPIEEEIEDGWAQLIACEINGVFYGDSTVLAMDDPILQPPAIELVCYPNPFNPQTTVSFDIPVCTDVKIVVYNLRGQKVRTLLDERLEAGTHSIVWDGRDSGERAVASSVYLIRINAGGEERITKALLLK